MTLKFGRVQLGTPVVLAPMAGVTNPPFRRLARQAAEAALTGQERATAVPGEVAPAGLFVTEMITSRALVERNAATMKMIEPDPGDPVRSIQLYGVDPYTVAAAVRILVSEDRADHIDLNFGCPVPKVTRKGGGAALPWKRDLFQEIVEHAVAAAGDIPVTIKMRMGIDDAHLTYLDAARTAQRAGVAAVALHARTAAQHYSGHAQWEAISRLKDSVRTIPVLGNGDVFDAADAIAMMEQTGCDGVVIGRGCQGRPWLFTDIVAALHGRPERVRPGLGAVAAVVRQHAQLAVEHFGDEDKALRELRKHLAWYVRGYPVGGSVRHELGLVSSLADLDNKLALLDLTAPYPGAAAEGRRGRAGGTKTPHLPDGWLDSPFLTERERDQLPAAELDTSGG